MVSDSHGLINVALTWSLIIPAMNVHSDIVFDISCYHKCGRDKCGPDKCGSDECSFDMICDTVSDNPGSEKQSSEQCVQSWADNPCRNKWIPALLGCEGDGVEPTSPSEPPWLNLRYNKSLMLWIKEYMIWLSELALTSVALTCVALTSVALTSAALTWYLTRSLTRSLTIPALIKSALASALWQDLTVPAAINVTDKCDYDMDCDSECLWLVLAAVLDRWFRTRSRSEVNHCPIGGPGCQYTRILNLGTIRWQSPNPSDFGGIAVGYPAGPSVDSYIALVFAVW